MLISAFLKIDVAEAAPSDPVNIPDSAFKTCVNKTISSARANGATVTQGDMATITTMNCSTYTAIANLTGAEYLVNATTLTFGNHANLTNLTPLGNLPKLQTLNITSTGVVSVTPLTTLPVLKTLNLSSNKITNLEALRNITSLTTLNMSSNPLRIQTQAQLDAYTYFVSIGGVFNTLPPPTDIAVFPDPEMRKCLIAWIHGNVPDTFTFQKSDMANWTWIGCENPVSNIAGMEHAVNLTRFDFYLANFPAFPNFTVFPKIERIQVADSGTTTLNPAHLANLPALKTLILSDSKLTSIAPLKDLKTLTHLDIRWSPITIWKHEDLALHQYFTSNLATYLHSLPAPSNIVSFTDPLMRRCLLDWFFGAGQRDDYTILKTDMTYIGTLDCRAAITSISGMEYATELTTFTIFGAGFTELPDVRVLPKIRYLAFVDGALNNVNGTYLSGINSLLGVNLRGNQLTDFSFINSASSPNLSELEIYNNKITSIPPTTGLSQTSLNYLDVRTNPIVLRTNASVVNHNNWLQYFSTGGRSTNNFHYDYSRGLFGLFNFNVSTTPTNFQLTGQNSIVRLPFANGFEFIDTRDDISGNHLAGWRIQASTTHFVDGSKTISNQNVFLSGLNTLDNPGFSVPADTSPALSSPITIATANTGSGAGTHSLNFSNVKLDVHLPKTTKIGTYTSTLSLQTVTGP